jgi:hypothetical protein
MQERKRIAPGTIAYRTLKNGCRIWLGHVEKNGYGQLCINYKRHSAHRWYWEKANGPIAPGLTIHHVCGVRLCVNPAHMVLVDPKKHSEIDMFHGANVQRRKTHCPKGHPYSAMNTYMHGNRRHCVICGRDRSREYQRKKRELCRQ